MPVSIKGGRGAVKSELNQEVMAIVREETAVAKSEAKAGMAHNGNPSATTANTASNKLNSSAIGFGTQTYGKAASSEVLGKNLEAVGVIRPSNTAAHHIVAGTDSRADLSRQVFQRENIDINEADNGVFLPKNTNYANPPASTHSTLHTDRYYQELNRRILGAQPGQVRQELHRINQDLQNGTFPH